MDKYGLNISHHFPKIFCKLTWTRKWDLEISFTRGQMGWYRSFLLILHPICTLVMTFRTQCTVKSTTICSRVRALIMAFVYMLRTNAEVVSVIAQKFHLAWNCSIQPFSRYVMSFWFPLDELSHANKGIRRIKRCIIKYSFQYKSYAFWNDCFNKQKRAFCQISF